MIMKTERTLLAFAAIVLLVLACRNVWVFLYKQSMYKSYPLTVTYILIIIFCLIEIGYNLTVMMDCEAHDCTVKLLMSDNETIDHIKLVHLPWIKSFAIVWTIR